MENNQKVGKAASAVGGMTMVSRLLGFIRDLVIAMQFGATAAADAFFELSEFLIFNGRFLAKEPLAPLLFQYFPKSAVKRAGRKRGR